MSAQLYLNRAYQNNLVYQIDDKFYDALTLTRYVFPEGTSTVDLEPIIPLDRLINLTSRPILILTYNKRFIFTENNGNLNLVYQSAPLDQDDAVYGVVVFKVPSDNNPTQERQLPDVSEDIFERLTYLANNNGNITDLYRAQPEIGVSSGQIPQPRTDLPGGSVGISAVAETDGHVNPYITSSMNGQAPLTIRPSSTLSEPTSPINDNSPRTPPASIITQIPNAPSRPGLATPIRYTEYSIPFSLNTISGNALTNLTSTSIPSSPTTSKTLSIYEQSFQTFIGQLYGFPLQLPSSLNINGTNIQFIDYNQAGQFLSSGQVVDYLLDPVLQPWAGLPSSYNPNRILLLIMRNGYNYLLKAQYDPVTRRIFPPI